MFQHLQGEKIQWDGRELETEQKEAKYDLD
jgi:hypothetical protein